jgi:hypothetical protein
MPGGDDSNSDDLVHITNAIEVYKDEKKSLRSLMRDGDRRTNKWVTGLGMLGVLLGFGAVLGPHVWLAWVCELLGIVAGTCGGATIYLQSRWNTRRAALDELTDDLDEKVLLLTGTKGELEGGPKVLPPPKRRRRRRKRGKGRR